MKQKQYKFPWLAFIACMLTVFALPMQAQEADDLQQFLDQLAAKQAAQPMKKAPRKGASVEIPVGLTEVDLSKFTSYQNRKTQLSIKASVKFVNGTITASADYAGGTSMLKVYGGATVVLDATAGLDAGAATAAGCTAAIDIREGSTFYQCGNITAPAGGVGVAVYLDTANDIYYYVSGTTKGSISNPNGGTVVGIDESPSYKDGETFTDLTIEGVAMTFQVVSASERTCRVGISSTAAIATGTQGVVTIPSKAKGYTVTAIANRAFKGCDGVTFIDIPSTVTAIGTTNFDSAMGAFHACSSLSSVNIPSSVTLIGRGTFSGCVSLTSLTMPNSVTTLGSNAFDGCAGLKSVTLSTNITSIQMETFRNCRSLESITIPAAVTSFGSSAFQNCNSLMSVTSLVQNPFSFSSGVFTNYNARLYVPAGTKNRYQSTACWNQFARIYTIGSDEELEDMKEKLAAIGTQLDAISTDQTQMAAQAAAVKTYLNNAALNSLIDSQLATLANTLGTLRTTYNDLQTRLSNAQAADYAALRSEIDQLWNDVAELTNTQNAAKQEVATSVANIVKNELETTVGELYAVQTKINTNVFNTASMESQTGTGFFLRQRTSEFDTMLADVKDCNNANTQEATQLVNSFNSMFNGVTISTIEQAVALYQSYTALKERLKNLDTSVETNTAKIAELKTAFDALSVVFPSEDDAWTLRPAGLTTELQMGYKSNRGFVLTNAGRMWLEQVSGATFLLHDDEANYVVATAGSTALRAGSKTEATVWTGQNLGNGTYTFYSETSKLYLGYSGITVNKAVTAEAAAYAWTISEGIDELQAFLNLLAEEQEEEGGQGTLQPTDTLFVVIPSIQPGAPAPTQPYVFPATPYPIVVSGPEGGLWPIPQPTPGKPRPADFHPIYIQRGSHVIIDDVTFQDIVGGNHVIYVEGTVEINVSVILHITNWEWFIHVAPGGQVIWRSTGGDMPRIKNEGTMDIYAHVDYILNTGTINHHGGNIVQVINRYHYYFYGGVINILWNYGQHYHEGGTALTARNFEGATFTMNSGYIRNTVVSETDTVFVNRGTFYFYGGIIGGYGSRLVYHGPGATMRIDGGHFEFDLVKHYWIEAHNFFYIRGDYDYGSPFPLLLNPGVTIRLLGGWTYTFPLQFIGGLPMSHYALFRAEGFTLIRDYFVFIKWTFPTHRWRWYLNEGDNAIEPRGEPVTDEDDLQAYLDWLAAEQDGEAKSSEEEPQQLDLTSHNIVITKPVILPGGCHVVFCNGTFSPKGTWTHDNVVYIPATTTLRLERVVIDYSSQTHYIVAGQPVQRRLLDIYGTVHFGTGCELRGYFDTSWQFTDTWHPGAVVYVDPQARLFIDGGRLNNVVYVWNTVVNVYISATFLGTIYVWLPGDCYREGFRFMASWDGYRPTVADLHRLVLWGADRNRWAIETVGEDYDLALYDRTAYNIADVNHDGVVDVADIATVITYMSDQWQQARADINNDGSVDVADIATIISAMAGIPIQ